MQRDKALNIFLFFVLASILFVAFFPIYFSFGAPNFRVVTLSERLFSLVFVALWLLLCVYSAWKKKLNLVLGAAAYAAMAYIPGMILPGLPAAESGDASLVETSIRFVFEKMYELVNAPMVGVSILFAERQSVSLSHWLLPVLLISYAATQIFRHYRNAYLAEQLHLEDTAYYPNPDLAREIASVPGTERVPIFKTQEQARASKETGSDYDQESLPASGEPPVDYAGYIGRDNSIIDPIDRSADAKDIREEVISLAAPDRPAATTRDEVISLGAPERPSAANHDEVITLGAPGQQKKREPKAAMKSDFDLEIKTDTEEVEETKRHVPPRFE